MNNHKLYVGILAFLPIFIIELTAFFNPIKEGLLSYYFILLSLCVYIVVLLSFLMITIRSPNKNKLLWILALFLTPFIAMPLYGYIRILKKDAEQKCVLLLGSQGVIVNITLSLIITCYSIALGESTRQSLNIVAAVIATATMVLGNILLVIIFLTQLRSLKLQITLVGVIYYVLLIVFIYLLFVNYNVQQTIHRFYSIVF